MIPSRPSISGRARRTLESITFPLPQAVYCRAVKLIFFYFGAHSWFDLLKLMKSGQLMESGQMTTSAVLHLYAGSLAIIRRPVQLLRRRWAMTSSRSACQPQPQGTGYAKIA